MSERKRLFFAINLPGEIREKIYSEFSVNLPDKECKIVAKENLHITLKFIGYMGVEGIKEIKEKISSIEFPKFNAVLKGIGSFGNRVIWVGVSEGSEEMEKLSAELNKALSTSEDRFHSHVTVARNKFLERKQMEHIIKTLNKREFEECFDVSSFELMESHLSAKGPRYEVLFSKELI